MTREQHYKNAIKYVAENIDKDEYSITLKRIDNWRCPVGLANELIENEIYDFMEEYGQDHDLPEGWWLEFGDVEDIFWELEI